MSCISVGNSWDNFLIKETSKPYFARLQNWIKQEEKKYVLYPSKENRYRAWKETPFNQVKVVICMSEPYNGHNMADGLALSSLYNKTRDLTNFLRKIEDELKISCDHENTDLTRWAHQGVFLLNMTLTTPAGKLYVHRNHDWYQLTYNTVKELYEDMTPKVFLLLGGAMKVQGAAMKVERDQHLVLVGAEPNQPIFFYKDYFCQIQNFLLQTGRGVIDWH